MVIVFESNSFYFGWEVILDLILYEGIVVVWVLDGDKVFLEKFGVFLVFVCYLIYLNGLYGLINVVKFLWVFFFFYLKLLLDVRKKLFFLLEKLNKEENVEVVVWREFDKFKLYMVDLELGLYYFLWVELVVYKFLVGVELKMFKDFVIVLVKLFFG